jgi:DNA polymerase-1
MKQNLLIFDGNNVLNRGFHAVPNLKAPDGTPTGALKGALNIMMKNIREACPSHIGAVFDHPSKNFRHELFSEYKGQRVRDPKKEELLNPQKSLIRDLLKALGIRVIRKRGYEADDIIGVLAKLGLPTLIVSNDKDFGQLLDKKIKLLRVTGSGDNRVENLITHKNCADHIGVAPKLVIQMLMLMGDKVDNIPGVKGVAETTAIKLLNQYGSISNLLTAASELTPALRNNLEAARCNFSLTQKLVTIRTDIIDYDPSRLLLKAPDEQRFTELCKELGLRQLRDHSLKTMATVGKKHRLF